MSEGDQKIFGNSGLDPGLSSANVHPPVLTPCPHWLSQTLFLLLECAEENGVIIYSAHTEPLLYTGSGDTQLSHQELIEMRNQEKAEIDATEGSPFIVCF